MPTFDGLTNKWLEDGKDHLRWGYCIGKEFESKITKGEGNPIALISAIQEYWLVNVENGEFSFSIKQISKRHNIPISTLHSKMKKYRHNINYVVKWPFEIVLCCNCAEILLVKNRTEYKKAFKSYCFCDECISKKLTKNNLLLVDEAYSKGVFESLNVLEFNYLLLLVRSDNPEKAAKELGVSNSNGWNIYFKLEKLHLLLENSRGFYIPKASKNQLLEYKLKKIKKSIFGSPKAKELYRELKKKHMFVFPEIPICVFVDKCNIENLFTESWHNNYFLTCRVDFVICDHDGNPEFAVEYQGGYHDDKYQQERDHFKKMILENVGIPLHEFDFNGLKNLKKETEG